MKEKIRNTVSLLAITVLFSGCAGMKANEPPLAFTPHGLPSGQYTPKVDNALFILDASNSMARHDDRKFLEAKHLIAAINQSLPADLKFQAGLRSFGHHIQQSANLTDLEYGMTPYTRDGLQNGLGEVRYAGGSSPMREALAAANGDLREAPGKSAILIVSDGLVHGAPAAAARLKASMGDKLCIYTIAVGGDPGGEKTLRRVARAGGCGFSVTAASLTSPDKLAAFVESVFLERKMMPAAAVAPPDGDRDGDGVADSRDRCPDTPKGEIVDEFGCTLKLTLHINFDFDKSDIKPEFAADLKTAGEFVVKNKDVPYILVEGYTDSVGEDAYNQKLSERRAEAVRQYLIDHFDIDPKRLVARGGGESNPVADNGTDTGRAENRRVEIVCCAVIPPSDR